MHNILSVYVVCGDACRYALLRLVDGYSDIWGDDLLYCKCTEPGREIKEGLSGLYSITLVRISEVAGKHCILGLLPGELCCSFLRDVLHSILPSSIWHFSRTEWISYSSALSHTTQMRSNN